MQRSKRSKNRPGDAGPEPVRCNLYTEIDSCDYSNTQKNVLCALGVSEKLASLAPYRTLVAAVAWAG